MTGFVPVEKCTIREIGGSLYVKIPSIIKSEGASAGDTFIWMRASQNDSVGEPETFGAQIEKVNGDSIS